MIVIKVATSELQNLNMFYSSNCTLRLTAESIVKALREDNPTASTWTTQAVSVTPRRAKGPCLISLASSGTCSKHKCADISSLTKPCLHCNHCSKSRTKGNACTLSAITITCSGNVPMGKQDP